MQAEHSQLGQRSAYIEQYQPGLLFPIPRQAKRDEINVAAPLPFTGYDLWNAYEISWLNAKGKPEVAIGTFVIPASSPYLIESKSLKLYLNSFNQTKLPHLEVVQNVITTDLSAATQSAVTVQLTPLSKVETAITGLNGQLLDNIDIFIENYSPDAQLLTIEKETVSETVHSHLLKSNCLVTNQPDWGSVEISYTGPKIDHAGLLKYLIGFRGHNEFHEQCVERIFMDISRCCQPSELTVYARYTRRGGIDINPYRSTQAKPKIRNLRLVRQ